MKHTSIPFEFVLDYLVAPLVKVKPMFGMFYVYAGGRIMLILRQRKNDAQLSGIWVATTPAHHKSLQKEIPSLVWFYEGDGKTQSSWLLLPEDDLKFESSAIQLCNLIIHGDARIGRVTDKSGEM